MDLAVLILAAGKGTRMKSSMPKVLHQLGGLPMIQHVIQVAQNLDAVDIALVVSPELENHFAHPTYIQKIPEGTGSAAQAALPWIEKQKGHILILCGDTPLLTSFQNINTLDADIVLVGMRVEGPEPYGRIIKDANEEVDRIVEFKDATPSERTETLCYSGVMRVRADIFPSLLRQLKKNNVAGEYYLTDIVKIAQQEGKRIAVVEGITADLLGINTRADLADAESILQDRWREAALLKGVTLKDKNSVYFSYDTQIAADVVVEPHVYFGPGVQIESGCVIHAFSYLEGVTLRRGAKVGPFARIRPESEIGENAKVGNFVEIKKSTLNQGAKVSHLSYIGDTVVGEKTNIGAGTITCNYDGHKKHKTTIGSNVFIGSNTALIAPITVGDGSIIGAGSVITNDVAANSLALSRQKQTEALDGANKLRQKRHDS